MQSAIEVGSGFFGGLCYNSTSKLLSPVAPSAIRRSDFKENYYILLRPVLALIALTAFFIPFGAPIKTEAALQDPKAAPQASPQETPQDGKKQKEQEPKQAKTNSNGTAYTVEQVVESVILVYGTRQALEHIRRNGVERGKITRTDPEGKVEETDYERRFIRGENLDKDKIRLDQKLPTMEYSLIFGDGKLWGLINGAAFTPRQDATSNFISQHHHSIDGLLRYKECGSTITLVGKDQQKGLDLFVVDLLDKEKRKTRYYISAKSLRVLWLEYEEGNPGGVPVKYTRKFLDYRFIQQTLAPYRTVLLEDGRQSQEIRVLTITYGSKISDAIFKNPEG